MAYSKKTWKARQGLGLNKFSIDGATPVAIVNQPDSVTQQGDALSAGNLNDLEDRIANAFDDVEESKVDKSTTDDLQNQIVNLNSDVATLDAIVGCEAEVENTDPSEGQSILSSSRLIHHVNLLPSGEFGLVGARDIVHEGSIVNLNPTGFSIRGINLWDEETELGIYNITTGQPSSSSINLRFKNRAEVSPSTSYYFFRPSLTIVALWYDADDNYISFTSVTSGTNTATSPSNAVYLRCYLASEYGTTYNHDIQIADNSLPSSVKTVYHAYNGQTVPVSISGHYVNENCYDYVTNKTVNGVLRGEVHTKVGTIALGSMNWVQDGSYMLSNSLSGIAKFPSSNANLGNMLCDVFMPVAFTGLNDNTKISMMQSGYVAVYGSTAPTSGNLYYELATEVVTYTEPLRSFSVSDYCTIEPITPQTIPNRIDVPFSVLSKSNNGLIEQITQNTADIADNKQILAQHEARIANLEQVSGDYVTEDMQDYSSVPTGKASFALVETMKGVSRVRNQLVPDKTSQTINDITFTVDNNNHTITMSGTATATASFTFYPDSISNGFKGTNGHYLLVYGQPFSEGYFLFINNGGFAGGDISSSSYPNGKKIEWTDETKGSGFMLRIPNGTTINRTVPYPVLVDLTLYFNGGTIPTITEIQSQYPELLEPRAYNAGEIVDSTYTKVESVGVNIFDEELELGQINDTTGAKESSSTKLRSKNNIIVEPNTQYYYVNGSNENTGVFFYDANDNYIGRVSGGVPYNSSFTTPSNARYLLFGLSSSYGTVNKHDIQICLNSYADKTTYHPYMTDTLAIPSVTLRSAGSVSDTLDVESGEITRMVGSYTFDGTETWNYNDDYSTPIFSITIADMVNGTNGQIANVLLAPYTSVASAYVSVLRDGMADKSVTIVTNNNVLVVRDSSYTSAASFATAMKDKTVYFQLATPSTPLPSTPIPDNFIEVEGGGTVYSDADVDGQFTMGFLNL